MSKQKYSLIYRSLFIYRLVLNILFFGKYRQRFNKVIDLLDSSAEKSIVEMCFGDIYIAQWCKEHGVVYLGLDINPHFVREARNRGYNVDQADLRVESTIPAADVAIIMGSLYHFHDILEVLIHKIMASCPRLIISEPIKNWASRDDIFGRIARNCANAGRGEEVFRYTERSLMDALKVISENKYSIDHSINGKEAIVDIRRLV